MDFAAAGAEKDSPISLAQWTAFLKHLEGALGHASGNATTKKSRRETVKPALEKCSRPCASFRC